MWVLVLTGSKTLIFGSEPLGCVSHSSRGRSWHARSSTATAAAVSCGCSLLPFVKAMDEHTQHPHKHPLCFCSVVLPEFLVQVFTIIIGRTERILCSPAFFYHAFVPEGI